MEIKQKVTEFLKTEAAYSHVLPDTIDGDLPLIDSNVLDSVGIFHMIVFLEKHFSIHVDVQDLSESNFATLNTIENFVKSKLALNG